VGYPEIEKDSQNPDQATCYNSLLIVDETGEVIHNYRKSFLYYTDETWAAEGQVERGYKELEIQEKQVATSFGICMDINPYKFEAPYTKWEFATRVLDSQSQLVILSMAWLTLLGREELDTLKHKPEMDTFNYWIQRFWPLLQKKMKHEVDIDGTKTTVSPKKIVIVFANRSGEEPSAGETKPPARYAGTSAIIAVTQKPTADSDLDTDSSSDAELPLDVKILCWDLMGAGEEGICFADTTQDPKMVFAMKKSV
jgi:protein N-terminal amidase